MFKKVLIIDDLDSKRNRIENYIKEIDSTLEINKFSYSRELQLFLRNFRNNKSNLENTILFLDWNFPNYKNDYPRKDAGMYILLLIENYNLPIKVVIVSSDEVDIDRNEYPFVLGTIKDDSSVYQKPLYEKILKGENL